MDPTALRSARARARSEITDAIVTVARRHVAEQGAPTLSLRAVAREVGMVSSAVYRYFPSRDDLLTRLIVDTYSAIAAAAEAGDASAARGDTGGRLTAMANAIRRWAIAHPHEWALVYGTPVPGYAAPHDTVDPAARVSMVMLGILRDGVAGGTIDATERIETTRAVRSDLAAIRRIVPGVPDAVIARGIAAWTQIFGHINFELFGHFHNVIDDLDGFFELQARRLAASVISPGVDRTTP